MAAKRIEWVDVYKGVLILTVVFGHSLQTVLADNGYDWMNNVIRNIIYSFHMHAFMAMSGYLVYKPLKQGGILYITNTYKKFKHLIVPLILWTILLAIAKNTSYIVLFLYPNKGYWFLWALFFIIVIYNFVDWLCNKVHLKQEIGMFCVSGVMVGLQMVLPDAQLLGYEYIAYYFIFFMMGYYANKYKEYLPQNYVVVAGLFALWFAMACFWTPNGLPFFMEKIPFVPLKLLQIAYRMLTPMVFVVAMYAAAPMLGHYKGKVWDKLIEFGQISLGIYLVHMVVKQHFAFLLKNLLPSLPIWSHIAIEFIALMFLSVGLVRLMQKWEITNKWLLGKF